MSYYSPTGNPGTSAAGLSATIRAEFAAVAAGFALLPNYSGNANKFVVVNSSGTGLTVASTPSLTLGSLHVTGTASFDNSMHVSGIQSQDASPVSLLGGANITLGDLSVATDAAVAGHVQVLTGIDFGTQLGSGPHDLSKHIDLYNGQAGICMDNSGNTSYNTPNAHIFWLGTTEAGYINSTGLNSMPIGQQTPTRGTFSYVQVFSTGGPTWMSGFGVPTGNEPAGSLYSNLSGTVGTTLYLSRGSFTWVALG